MNVAPDQTLLRHFLVGYGTIVAVGRGSDGWAASLAGDGRSVIAVEAPGPFDGWCGNAGLRHIDGLLLHGGAGALATLATATEMLRLRRIDFIQFDQDEAGGDLPALYALLQGYGYTTFHYAGRHLQQRREPAADGQPCVHLAVAPRHWKRLFSRDITMFRYTDLFPRYGIVPRGIVHVGAHEGEEYAQYLEAGCRRVLFIEADPGTFARLAPASPTTRTLPASTGRCPTAAGGCPSPA